MGSGGAVVSALLLDGVQPAEVYIDASRLAVLMGVSRTTVKRWTAAGLPSETWGMKRTRRFRLSEAIAWARAREAAMASGDDQPVESMTSPRPGLPRE
jgi:phage terminase Nu1 subunit (DNA packaging protein)